MPAINYARKAAIIPARNMPSNVPAPPIDTDKIPYLPAFLRLSRSAPIRVPAVALTYAITGAATVIPPERIIPHKSAHKGGIKKGALMPTPDTGFAIQWVTSETTAIPVIAGKNTP